MSSVPAWKLDADELESDESWKPVKPHLWIVEAAADDSADGFALLTQLSRQIWGPEDASNILW